MRIRIKTTKNQTLVPFNYQPKLVGILHKWLGINELHGKVALHSFSWLQNSKTAEGGLNYPNGADLFISFHDETNIKQIVKSILNDAEMCFGMKVADVTIEKNPDLTNKTLFRCASPVFVRYCNKEGKDVHCTYKDENAGKLMENLLSYKMELAGLPKDDSLKIRFDTSAKDAKIKIIDYRGVKSRVNLCPIIIEGKPETKVFAWNVGIGHSTGIGFGSIY